MSSSAIQKIISSCPDGFCKNGIFKNLTKITGKHLCQTLFFTEVEGLRPARLQLYSKKGFDAGVFL